MNTSEKQKINTFELVLFAILGALTFAAKLALSFIPNVHLSGLLIVVFTLCLGKKALIPIYIYVILEGVFYGFNVWWVPYLYVWAVLWGMTYIVMMIMPEKTPKIIKMIIYSLITGIHGLSFGTLFTFGFAPLMNMNLNAAKAWIIAGLPFDIIHGISNFILGFLIIPLSELMKKLLKSKKRFTN